MYKILFSWLTIVSRQIGIVFTSEPEEPLRSFKNWEKSILFLFFLGSYIEELKSNR